MEKCIEQARTKLDPRLKKFWKKKIEIDKNGSYILKTGKLEKWKTRKLEKLEN